MKTYIQPATITFAFQASQRLAASDKLTGFDAEKGSGTLVNSGASGDAMTREHRGFGSGMWEDMK